MLDQLLEVDPLPLRLHELGGSRFARKLPMIMLATKKRSVCGTNVDAHA